MGESGMNEHLAALDLSVRCSTTTSSPRTSPDEKLSEDFIKVECDDAYGSLVNGNGSRKRPYGCTGLESMSPPISSLDSIHRAHPSTTVYKSESDSDSQYSPRYSPPLRGDPSGYGYASSYQRNETSPLLMMEPSQSLRCNISGSSMYQMGSTDERTAAFVQAQQQRTVPVPMKYVPELSANTLNAMTRDGLASLTKQLNQADILQKLYADCSPFSSFPFVGHGGAIYHRHATPTSASVPAGVAVPNPPPPPSSGTISSGPAALVGVLNDLHSSRLIPPRKRFLAGIRNKSEGSGPNTASPNSDTNHSVSPPPRYPSPSPTAADQSCAPSGSSDDKKSSSCRPISAQEKDAAYWERRRKNNEAAKRSRDIRRQKEEQIATQAAMLNAENVQLKAQIDVLKTQLALVQNMMLNGAAHRQS